MEGIYEAAPREKMPAKIGRECKMLQTTAVNKYYLNIMKNPLVAFLLASYAIIYE